MINDSINIFLKNLILKNNFIIFVKAKLISVLDVYVKINKKIVF